MPDSQSVSSVNLPKQPGTEGAQIVSPSDGKPGPAQSSACPTGASGTNPKDNSPKITDKGIPPYTNEPQPNRYLERTEQLWKQGI